eukprot:364388-Chlamydomonas_euryale.AAC.13
MGLTWERCGKCAGCTGEQCSRLAAAVVANKPNLDGTNVWGIFEMCGVRGVRYGACLKCVGYGSTDTHVFEMCGVLGGSRRRA